MQCGMRFWAVRLDDYIRIRELAGTKAGILLKGILTNADQGAAFLIHTPRLVSGACFPATLAMTSTLQPGTLTGLACLVACI